MREFPIQYDLKAEDVVYFCHIPKTAGMTFRTILEDQFHCREICPATLKSQINHIPQAELDQHRLFRGHLISVDIPTVVPTKNVLNLTVLRDPVKRVISHYDYICRTPGDPHYQEVSNMTLEDFTRKMTVARVGKNIQAYHVAKTLKFDLERLPPDEVMALAKESIDKFAFVGILENFQDSLYLLSYIFGWKPILNSRKENAAGNKSVSQVSESTLDLIRESTALDQQLYDYSKEIFAERFQQMNRELLEQYGDADLKAKVGTSERLSPEVSLALLEKHYERRYAVQSQTSSSDHFSYDFCQPLMGWGWQRRECPAKGAAYRWIGPDPVSTLELPITTDRDLTVEIRTALNLATAPDILDSLSLEVNDHSVPLAILHNDTDTRILQGTIPKTVFKDDRSFAQLRFKINRVVPFKSINPASPDSRSVGVAVNHVQVFPAEVAQDKSLLLFLFNSQPWKETADFVANQVKPGDRLVAPLAFQLKLNTPILPYEKGFEADKNPQWVILNKGSMHNMNAILFKLIARGLFPVFANEVFVVFSSHKELPKLSYLSQHVRSLYVDRVKFYAKAYLNQRIKPIHESLTARNQKPKKVKAK